MGLYRQHNAYIAIMGKKVQIAIMGLCLGFRVSLVYGSGFFWDITPIMESHMEENAEDEMQALIMWGYRGDSEGIL